MHDEYIICTEHICYTTLNCLYLHTNIERQKQDTHTHSSIITIYTIKTTNNNKKNTKKRTNITHHIQ